MNTRPVIAAGTLAAVALGACSKSTPSNTDTTATAAANGTVATSATDSVSGTTMLRGTIASLSGNTLSVQSDSGTQTVQLAQAVQVFDRENATLAQVTPNAFIGVTTVKQPDGSERATEIHVFPEALRGLGEGSRPMAPAGGTARTMTNGATSTMTNGTSSTMTNGKASTMTNGKASTMSNGSVSSTSGSTMVVQYAGGSKTVTVPPNVPVTEIAPTSHTLAVGDQVVVLATRGSDGSLTTNRVLMASKPSGK